MNGSKVIIRFYYVRRTIVSIQYVLMTLAGIVSFIRPSTSVYSVVPPGAVYTWAGFLVVGGAVSFVGAATGYRIGEVIGVPLVGSACVIYALSVIYQSSIQTTRSVFVFVFVGMLILSYAVGLLDRFISAWNIVHVTEEIITREEEDDATDQ